MRTCVVALAEYSSDLLPVTISCFQSGRNGYAERDLSLTRKLLLKQMPIEDLDELNYLESKTLNEMYAAQNYVEK